MTDWMNRARAELTKNPLRATANRDEGPSKAPAAVPMAPLAGDRFDVLPSNERLIRAELVRIMGPHHPDFGEALSLALADPSQALPTLRLTARDRRPA